MTKKVLSEIRELDTAAEKAGGYVLSPGSVRPNPKGERDFTAIRQYSMQNKIPVSKLTNEDYRKIGISKTL